MSSASLDDSLIHVRLPRNKPAMSAMLVRDYFTNAWFPLSVLTFFGFLIVVSCFVFDVFVHRLKMTPITISRDDNIITFFFTIVFFSILSIWATTGIASDRWKGFPSRQFLLPIRTTQLVFMRWSSACVSTIAIYVTVSIVANVVLGYQLPIISPALALLGLITLAVGVSWTFRDKNIVRNAAWLFLFVALISASIPLVDFEIRYTQNGDLYWSFAALLNLFIVAAITAIGLATSMQGVHSDRVGSFEPWFSFKGFADQAINRQPVSFVPFPSPWKAQFWYEFRTRIWIAPMICFLPTLIFTLMAIWDHSYYVRNPGNSLQLILIVPSIVSLMIGIIFGVRRQARRAGLWTFQAVQPISDRRLAQPIVLGVFVSFLACMLPAIFVMFAMECAFYPKLFEARFLAWPLGMQKLWVGICILIGQWVFITSTIAIIVSGRNWFIATAALSVEFLFVVCIAISMSMQPSSILFIASIASAVTATCAIAFVMYGIIRGKCNVLHLAFAIMVYMLAVLVTVSVFEREGLISLIIPLGLFMLVLTPAVSIPLAISTNRHR